jgi:hypothetical protein
MTLFPVDTGEQMLQFGVDFEDRLERQTGVAVLSDDEARDLHNHYYKEYGLAIRGLVRHHKVDPLD